MRKISGIAVNTFRESIREKLLYIALLFGGILMVSTYILSPLAIGAQQKIVMDIGLATISILGVLTAVLVGSTLVHKEVDKKAVFLVLTRPVSRSQYLIGKFFGVVLAITLMVAVMTVFMVLAVTLGGGGLRPAVFAALYLSLLEMMVMCAVVVFFSTFTTPVLTSFFSLCFFVAGSLSNDLREFAQKLGGAFMKYVMEIFYYLLPNLKVFNLRHEAVHNLHFRGNDLILATVYAAVYCGVVLYFAYLVFRRREFV
jgi:ABC-type transport system involved in multi-copper enzyme maturation permease subunit